MGLGYSQCSQIESCVIYLYVFSVFWVNLHLKYLFIQSIFEDTEKQNLRSGVESLTYIMCINSASLTLKFIVFQDHGRGEPNSPESERCVAMATSDGKWWDENCSAVLHAICEIDIVHPHVDKLYYF